MDSTLQVHLMTDQGDEVKTIANIDLNGGLNGIVDKVATALSLNTSEFDLVYAGRILNHHDPCSKYELFDGCTVYCLKKKNHGKTGHSKQHSKDKTIACAHSFFKSLERKENYKSQVQNELIDPFSRQRMLTAMPELEQNPVVLTMLQNPDTFLGIIQGDAHHTDRLKLLLDKHPVLGKAVIYLQENMGKGKYSDKNKPKPESPNTKGSSMRYGLDEMSDDEDDDEMAGGSRPRPITAAQLMQALATASGLAQSPTSGNTSNTSSASAGASATPARITTDYFRQAMATVAGATPAQTVTESQLQQMREMGITNEVVARQALEATGGNIQAALELLFEQ